jgi:hypothetical protein
MNWNTVMGLVSTVALTLPIIMILATKLGSYKSFPFLLAYYAIATSYNILTEGYITAPGSFVQYFGITNNLLDAPLMLFFLTYFSTSPSLSKKMKWLAALFVAFEIVILSIYGVTVEAITITLGPGLLLVFGFSAYFFVRQTRITIMHQKAGGKALMISSLIFAYGCYSIIYVIYYLFKVQQNEGDSFLIFFLVTTVSALLMATGIVIERKRVQKLNELKVTRKELAEMYGEKKTTILRTAAFDFDKEQWT